MKYRWVCAEILAHELGISIDSVKMQAIIAGCWDSKRWKVLMRMAER